MDVSTLIVTGHRRTQAEEHGRTGANNTWDEEQEDKARRIADEDLNHKSKQSHRGLELVLLAWQSTGVIYGDIGTSPLYVYSSTFATQPSWDDLVGALSIIIWSVTLILMVKYCLVVLSADDDGQGGTFALYTLLSRHARIGGRGDPSQCEALPSSPSSSSSGTRDVHPAGRKMTVRGLLEGSGAAQIGLRLLGVAGVSMVLSDGILTPAQSVLGAVQGITVVNPDLQPSRIVAAACCILVCLFAIQPLGVARVGTSFAPIIVVWLLFNLGCGIYNLARYDHAVLAAFNPAHAVMYMARNGADGWRSLGGLLLAFTGVEALFADIGAFGKRAIQISCICLVYPCLMVTYCGQAAYIAADPTGEAFANPFFSTLPPGAGTLYFGLAISVLAAVVASQAMITSAFQLLSQVMRLSYFPHIRMIHTSGTVHHQVYIPVANWLLMVGSVVVAAVFQNTMSLGNAYGVCVIADTVITTTLVSLVALVIWRIPFALVLPLWLGFACLEGAYLTSALRKVPAGAWLTVVLAMAIGSLLILWRYGKEQQWVAELKDRMSMDQLLGHLQSDRAGTWQLIESVPAEIQEEEGGGGADGAEGSEMAERPERPEKAERAERPERDEGAEGAGQTEEEEDNDNEPDRIRIQVTAPQSPAGWGVDISLAPGLGIFFDKIGTGGGSRHSAAAIPKVFAQFVTKFRIRPEVVVFFHMRPLLLPTVAPSQRHVITRTGPATSSCYRVTLRHGYRDDVLTADLGERIAAELAAWVTRGASAAAESEGRELRPGDVHESAQEEWAVLRRARQARMTYIMGKQVLRAKTRRNSDRVGAGNDSTGTGMRIQLGEVVRRTVLGAFMWVRENTRTKLADWEIDMDKLVEVGWVKEI